MAAEISQRAITLIKDAKGQVPLKLARNASVLYLSVLDYPNGWRIATPSRTYIPELRRRYPGTTSIEVSDRTTPAELDLIRASATKYDAIVISVFVRAPSGRGRMDLAAFFGNPYAAMYLADLPAMLVTYDLYDGAEAAAVRALVGEAPITGRLPITMPGMYEAGTGIIR